MNKRRFFLFLVIATPVILVVCLSMGASGIGIPDTRSDAGRAILFLRFNRVACGFVVGAALSCAGVVFQAILRNPLAEPYILGVSSGAGLGAAIAILTGFAAGSILVLPVIAFVAAALALMIVYTLASDGGAPSVYGLILSGVIVSSICSSLLMFLVATAPTEGLHSVLWWMLGNLQPSSRELLMGSGIAVAGGACAIWLLAPELNALTLGLETLGGVLTTLISRNTTIPTRKNENFTTAANGQTTVDIHVLQGERSMAADNKSIGRFMLDGLLPAPRGVPQIEVSFDIDANGILSVSAQDKGTGKEQKIVIQSGSGLSKEDIEQMINDAKSHEEEDQRRRAETETRNQADSLVYTTEKLLQDNADKVPEDLKTEVEAKIATLKTAIASNNVAEMQTATNDLNESMQRLGEAVYSQATASPDEPADGDSDPGEQPQGDDTVEGEFREV
ncbi:MAG: Hsp70 family protein [Planctomycetes bacterium]|nr:Hsp70 family protein [Planctomycetota bacterium]